MESEDRGRRSRAFPLRLHQPHWCCPSGPLATHYTHTPCCSKSRLLPPQHTSTIPSKGFVNKYKHDATPTSPPVLLPSLYCLALFLFSSVHATNSLILIDYTPVLHPTKASHSPSHPFLFRSQTHIFIVNTFVIMDFSLLFYSMRFVTSLLSTYVF